MLTVDIVSDFVCPWCFIGTRRLAAALAEVRRDRPDFACQKRWRPFFLNPDTPPAGEPYLPFLERKFGGRAAVEGIFERVRQAGQASGVTLAFENIPLRVNTLQAHRLLHWAQRNGDAEALVERLFVGNFHRGENLGDTAVLRRIAEECGYPGAEVAAYLAADVDRQTVLDREQEVHAMGINMVPTFIVGGREVIVGAEDPSILAAAMRPA